MNEAGQGRPNFAVDLSRKYVHVRQVGTDGNVRFDFAIGWPELSVELVLPQAAFEEFCRRNEVRQMPAPDKNSQWTGEGETA